MYWENIEGMFTFQILYNSMINNFPSGSLFVEIGAWKGKSTIFMAERIKESGKSITFYTIDPFNGDGGGYDQDKDVKNNTLFDSYNKNIEPVKSYINTIKAYSYDAVVNFKDQSIDFLFIDGDHRYEGVRKDLNMWFPKIKDDGIISGHDYNEPSCGVKQAVDEFFRFGAQPYVGGCWIFYK